MSFHGRIHTIYVKELIDILRDRRTLIAMMVVPIVLYPLLMLGSVQALSYQAESVSADLMVIGVISESQAGMVRTLIERDAQALRDEPDQHDSAGGNGSRGPVTPLNERARIQILPSREALQAAIRDRAVHVGVVFASDLLVDAIHQQNNLELLSDPEEIRSGNATQHIQAMIDRLASRAVDERKKQAGLPEAFDKPFKVRLIDLSAPASVLGQILPLVLILMTITGAIYPAIDLTAGERERGTLESLMVCPVPVIDLIAGKFLVVTTVAILGAALNLASVCATVYFGGFDAVIAGGGGHVPYGKMAFILLSLIPFAVLMSAIMIAVCSYARTFKEAQNYVTPVILAVLVPGGIAALPASRLAGAMLVMPVGNMVLLTRDVLLGVQVPGWQVAMVLLSTSLYAGAAVALATRIFGQESVVFADAGSLKATFNRRLIKPVDQPPVTLSLLLVSLLFPAWFFVQSALSPQPDEDARRLLFAMSWLMPLMFVFLPLAALTYWKVDLRSALGIRMPSVPHMAAAVILGLTAWVPARELAIAQDALWPTPQAVYQSEELLAKTLSALPLPTTLLLIAFIPAVCEEVLFRGFLLSGLRGSQPRWAAILISAGIFGVFHFVVFKFAVMVGLGAVLAYLCWQSRSIVTCMIMHFLHNGLAVLSVVRSQWYESIGLQEGTHLPLHILLSGCAMFAVGLLLVSRSAEKGRSP